LIVAWAPAIALMVVVRVAFAEAYHIPSGSMIPALLEGDALFVNKLRFGPHIPFTSVNLPGYAEPKRGDIVVFVSPPQDPAIRITPGEITPTLVKRIAGAPGDTLFMRDGVLFVNGIEAAPTNGPAVANAERSEGADPLLGWQHGIEVRNSRFHAPPTSPTLHTWGPLLVPPRQYFMLGDNRDDSIDSRYYGPVPRRNIRGTPMFVYYSYDIYEGLDYFRAVTEIRWQRIGHWVR
jgi:signal peptidase I